MASCLHFQDRRTWIRVTKTIFILTRKYPLRGYILGVLTHTTALDQLWGGDETLTMRFKIEYTHLGGSSLTWYLQL